MQPIKWSCKCGSVVAEVVPDGTRVICYCASCQAFARHLGCLDVLDAQGGSDLFQTLPEDVTIVKGLEKLDCLRLTERGPLRWFTNCCNTPLCNTGARRGLPLAGFLVAGFSETARLGPPIARVNRKSAQGRVEGDKGSWKKVVLRFVGRAIESYASLGFRHNPFFDKGGRPIAQPYYLDDDERKAAYAR